MFQNQLTFSFLFFSFLFLFFSEPKNKEHTHIHGALFSGLCAPTSSAENPQPGEGARLQRLQWGRLLREDEAELLALLEDWQVRVCSHRSVDPSLVEGAVENGFDGDAERQGHGPGLVCCGKQANHVTQ